MLKIGEIKIIHLILVIIALLWIYLFTDWQITKYQLTFTGWQKDIVGAVNNLDNRLKMIEQNRMAPTPPQIQPQPKKGP